jgi:pyruvate dehydrogenase E2 component (dihydrolipoamide acetyltransferase)
MTTETVLMPNIDGSGEVVEFCVEAGDQISIGDSLLVIESDKASMEVPSPADGTVISWKIELGADVVSDSPLMILEITTPTEPVKTDAQETSIELPIKAEIPSHAAPIATKPETDVEPVNNNQENSTLQQKIMVNAGPAVRKLARELGISLSDVPSGERHNRILKEDLKAYAKQQLSQTPTNTALAQGLGIPSIPLEDFSRYGPIEHKSMSNIAKATEAHMSRCWLNIPHVTLFDDVNIDDIETFRRSLDHEALGLARRPTLLPFIIAIVARALKQFPRLNASFDKGNNQLIEKSYINIGFAVDSPAGLVVPVIRDADRKDIRELVLETTELSGKARERKLAIDDIKGGCFTISSMGAIGGTGFTPIINGPEVAILGIAKSAIKPQWNGEKFVPASMLPLCLSFDHRVVNGGDAGRFMAYIHSNLKDIRRVLL